MCGSTATDEAFTNFGRDLIQKDGWETMQKGIKELERCVNEDSNHISLLTMNLHVESLAKQAEERCEMLQQYLQIAGQHLS